VSERKSEIRNPKAEGSPKSEGRIPAAAILLSVFFALGISLRLLQAQATTATAPDAIAPGSPAETNTVDRERRGRFGGVAPGVYKARINPHWFQNNTRFWYRNDLRGGAKEFIVVDADKGLRQPAFDHQRLATALSKAASTEYAPDHLPFSEIEFIEDGKALRFEAGCKTWRCDLNSWECAPAAGSESNPSSTVPASGTPNQNPPREEDSILAQRQQDQTNQAQTRTNTPAISQRRRRTDREAQSPDGKWTAFIKDNNVAVRAGTE